MKDKNNYRRKRIWISSLMIISSAMALLSVNFPADHFLPYSPMLMYVIYSLMAVLSVASLILVFFKPKLADVLTFVFQGSYFALFGVLFVKYLLNGFLLMFPLITFTLFIMTIIAVIAIALLLFNKNQLGYLLGIIIYSYFLFALIFESYPVAYDFASEVYTNIKLVYFAALMPATILGIIHSSQMYKKSKEKPSI